METRSNKKIVVLVAIRAAMLRTSIVHELKRDY